MADAHISVPPARKQSVTNRAGKQHQKNCAGWISNKKPFQCNAHHILPVTCFNPIELSSPENRAYVKRCIKVSKWDINGGNRFPFPKGSNNMVRLPLQSAYFKRYPKKSGGSFKAPYPINECMHNSRYSEHYLYTKEVRQYLDDKIWKTLKENKKIHKGKGKDILNQLQSAEKYFRSELVTRGQRNKGTISCWNTRNSNPKWSLPFSMAHSKRGKPYGSKSPK